MPANGRWDLIRRLKDISLLYVQLKSPDDGQRNCPKHVEFHSKNKFEKSVHLSWFYYKKFITMHGHMNVFFYFDNKRKEREMFINETREVQKCIFLII